MLKFKTYNGLNFLKAQRQQKHVYIYELENATEFNHIYLYF